MAAYKNQQCEIAHMMEFVKRFRAKNTKAAQAQSKLKQIERMERIEAPAAGDRKIHFRFPQPVRGGLKSVTLKDVHHAYGENVIYRGVDFQAERGQRVVLTGPNGAGKSTLLKILAGVLHAAGGGPRSGAQRQERATIRSTAWRCSTPNAQSWRRGLDTPRPVTEEFVRTVLGCFLFRGDDVFKKVSGLERGREEPSGPGQTPAGPAEFIVRWTNRRAHLDMAGIEALIAALKQFSGTIVFISHNVYFIRRLSTHVVRVAGGGLAHFSGGCQYYLDKTAAPAEPPRPRRRRPARRQIQRPGTKADQGGRPAGAIQGAKRPRDSRGQSGGRDTTIGGPSKRVGRRIGKSRQLRKAWRRDASQPRMDGHHQPPQNAGPRMGTSRP